GNVLNLPPGATAVSPAMCLSPDYAVARAQVRNLTTDSSGAAALSVAYQDAGGWSTPVRAGNISTKVSQWTLSSEVKLPPANASGWQLARFTLTSSTTGKGFQVEELAAQASTTAALASVDTSACAKHTLSQSLMGGKDFNWYAMTPGMSAGTFNSAGWTLTNGATIAQTQRADGRTGAVLHLPNKAKAVSPLMCVSSDYRLARAQIRSLTL